MSANINNSASHKRKLSSRVPIPMNEVEEATLEMLANIEQRSKAGMARIIYLAGLKQFTEKTQQASAR